jgi:hypothetical protein
MSVIISDPKLIEQLAAAGPVVELTDPTGQPLGVLTRSNIEAIIEAAKALGEHPLFEDHVKAVEEYRRVHNTTEPDAE